MLSTIFLFLGYAIPVLIIFYIASLISKSKWVNKNFPQLSNKLSKELNLKITEERALDGIQIGPDNSNHIILGKHKTKLSVKYVYNFRKKIFYDIVSWEYERGTSIDEIILSVKTNIENTEPLLNNNNS